MTRKVVYLDRDGVINHDSKHYIRKPDEFRYFDHTQEAFEVLASIPISVVVVTNQSGLARGYTTPEDVTRIHERLAEDARAWGVELLSIEHCPHHPDEGCDCRKPRPGMFRRAAASHAIDLATSYMVGDAPSDIEAGLALGMTTVRVLTGRGIEPGPAPAHTCDDLLHAARWIQKREGR